MLKMVTVSLSSDGQISFTPIANYNGLASFQYVGNTPEGGRSEAVVYINVLPVNDDPTANNDSGFVTLENVALSISKFDLINNDTDIDGDRLEIIAVIGNADLQVTLAFDGAVIVTPTPYFFGNADFDYVISDGNGGTSTATASVSVTPVNNAPEPVADAFTIDEDVPLLVAGSELTANDFDGDGDPLEIISVSRGFGGNVELFANQTVLFSPSANFFGQAHYFYTVDDGEGGQAQTRVDVQVNPVNDAPSAQNDSYTSADVFYLNGTEDVVLAINIADLLGNDSDIDSPVIDLVTIDFSDHGTATIVGTQILFTPDQDYWGEAQFRYLVADDHGITDDALVTMYFEPVGDAPPVAVDDHVTVFEDVVTIIPKEALLGNDTDIDLDALEITSVSIGFGFTGSVSLNADGDVVFTPLLNDDGISQLSYTVSDNADGSDSAKVFVDILPVNDAPTAAPDTGSTSLDVPLILRISDLLANDSDVDLPAGNYDLLSFVGIRSTTEGTATIYDNEFVVVEFSQGFNGPLSLEYTIADDLLVEDDGTILATVSDTWLGTLTGSGLRDLIIGSQLGENIESGDGDDDLFGREGDDIINGGDGADNIDGGLGFDIVDFAGSNIGVRADIQSRLGQGGFAQGDLYDNIEGFSGTDFADQLFGDGRHQ